MRALALARARAHLVTRASRNANVEEERGDNGPPHRSRGSSRFMARISDRTSLAVPLLRTHSVTRRARNCNSRCSINEAYIDLDKKICCNAYVNHDL